MPGDAQRSSPPHRVTDEDNRYVAITGVRVVQGPARIGDGRHLLAVPAAIAITQQHDRESGTPTGTMECPRERTHANGAQMSALRQLEAVGPTARQHDRDRSGVAAR